MNSNRYIGAFAHPLSLVLRPFPFDGDGDDEAATLAKALESDAGKSAIAKAVEAATDGLRGKNDELLKELKQAKDAAGKWGDLDPDDVRKKLEALEKDDDLEMLKSGKLDELVAKRVEKIQAASDEKLTKVQEELASLKTERDEAKARLTKKTVDDKLRDAAVKAKVAPEAITDVLLRANGVFTVGEDGEVEARDSSGALVRVKVGDDGAERILTPELFIESLKKIAPHYWGQGRGSGSRGSGEHETGGRGDVSTLVGVAGDAEAYRQARRKKAASK